MFLNFENAVGKFRLTVPSLKRRAVSAELMALTEFVGGCTETDQRGVWRDDSGMYHVENVVQHEWLVFGDDGDRIKAKLLLNACITALLDSGEKAVLSGTQLYRRT